MGENQICPAQVREHRKHEIAISTDTDATALTIGHLLAIIYYNNIIRMTVL